MNSTASPVSSVDVFFSATNGASVLLCSAAAILVFAMKLYKRVVYRLALYQVLAALAIALAELSQIIMVNYEDRPSVYGQVCVAIGYSGLYALWVKLLFTMWLSFHLFCLSVLGKNMKKLELVYVVTSLVVPAAVASVPLGTRSYAFSEVDGCSIPVYSYNRSLPPVYLPVAVIERFSLVEGPALLILLASSSAMIVMVIKLAHSVYKGKEHDELSVRSKVRWAALKQLLPLAAFPVVFLVFVIPFTVFDVYYSFITAKPDEGLVFIAYLSTSLWSVSSGVMLLIHILAVRCPARCGYLRASARFYGGADTLRASGDATNRNPLPAPSVYNETETTTIQS